MKNGRRLGCFVAQDLAILDHGQFLSSPGEKLMTIEFRLFGYVISFSIGKPITIPSHRFDGI